MDINVFLSRVQTLTNALTILEGMYNDHDGDIEEKCIDLFTALVDVNESVNKMRKTLREIAEQIKVMAMTVEELNNLHKHIAYVRSQLPEESVNPFEPKRLIMDINETMNAQNIVSPLSVNWTQLVSPSQNDTKSIQPQIKAEKFVPSIPYVTEAEVNTVPKYMKGRCNAINLNKLIDSLNLAFKKKYETVTRSKKTIKQKDLEYYCEWKRDENTEPKGTCFITVKDVNTFGNMKMDKTAFNMITILRHLKRIKETRHANNQIHFVLL